MFLFYYQFIKIKDEFDKLLNETINNDKSIKIYSHISIIYCILYNLSYSNFFKKDILIKNNKIINKGISFIKDKLPKRNNKKIKILIVSFYDCK